MIITLDGPAGSGKSTTARALAKKLGGVYLDTGAMYRSVTLLALESGTNPADAAKLDAIAGAIAIDFQEAEGGQKVFVNGREVTAAIRTPEIDASISAVSAHPGVREKMVAQQRGIAQKHKTVIVEGRDAGSVVFPNADHKFFLSANPAERGKRRALQTGEPAEKAQEIAKHIVERDAKDSSRLVSPLVVPRGAVEIDNSHLSLDETIEKILQFLA
ncbi:MAG: (d)CMP kinase [Nitrospinae bacterium]|nr:(d)CMP kinase [Nitrospinota bacterium]